MDTKTVAEQAPATAPGFEYFEHAEPLLELMGELDLEGDEGQFQMALRARGWDLAVERAALDLHDQGMDLPSIAKMVVLELRDALRRSGRMDACDEALLLLAEYRIAAEGSVLLNAKNEVVNSTPPNLAAMNAQTMGGFAAQGDARHFGISLRDVVRDIACKGDGDTIRGVDLVRDFARGLLHWFGELGKELEDRKRDAVGPGGRLG